MNSVPANLITGFLGVGKTTAVIDLLKRKGEGARWAVLVNEYGAVPVDDALIEGSAPEGVTVKEVGGGCDREARSTPSLLRGGGRGGRGSYITRYLSPGEQACGWIFDPQTVFDEAKLLALLANTEEVTRLKGVFRLADEWAAVNRAGTAVSVSPTAYRRDSRLEVFATGLDWTAFERALAACVLVPCEGEQP